MRAVARRVESPCRSGALRATAGGEDGGAPLTPASQLSYSIECVRFMVLLLRFDAPCAVCRCHATGGMIMCLCYAT